MFRFECKGMKKTEEFETPDLEQWGRATRAEAYVDLKSLSSKKMFFYIFL